ncbi:hypothetical protein MBLNU230_g1335t1 [Neophaeotheca triangularis]
MYALKRFPVLATLAAYATAQSEPIAPSLAFMYHMDADLGDSIHMGAVPHGQDRTVIPILGGTFKGPQLSEMVKCGPIRGILLTDDGAWIYVQTRGQPLPNEDRLLLHARFEAATDGSYDWLNDVVGVGVLSRNGSNGVGIDMWQPVVAPVLGSVVEDWGVGLESEGEGGCDG